MATAKTEVRANDKTLLAQNVSQETSDDLLGQRRMMKDSSSSSNSRSHEGAKLNE